MGCGNSNFSCGEKVYDNCVYSEIVLPSWSGLDDCKVQSEINEELYAEVTILKSLTDISDKTSACFTLDTDDTGTVTLPTFVDSVIRELNGLICPDPLAIPNDLDITKWGLDYTCLQGECDTAISRLSQLQQLLINKACEGSDGTCCSLESARIVGNSTTADIYINSLTVGKGALSLATNTAFGDDVLQSVSSSSGNYNTGVGYQVLKANLTGDQNSGFGAWSLLANTTGRYNTGCGFETLYSNLGGSYNTAAGASAMTMNTSGVNNSAFGYYALNGNVVGGNSVAIGYQCLLNATNSGNTGVGSRALYSLLTGVNNVSIGNLSGDTITTGSNNTIIGANISGVSSSLTSNILIGIGTGSVKLQYKNTEATWYIQDLPVYASNAAAVAGLGAAISGGLCGLYRDSSGNVKQVI